MAARTLSEIAAHVGGELEGDGGLTVDRPAALSDADAGSLTFFSVPRHLPQLAEKYLAQLQTTRATAAIAPRDCPAAPCALIRVDNPDLAFGLAVELLAPPPPAPPPGVHPAATVAESARLGEDAAVGAGAVIGENASIGARTVIHPRAVIGPACTIGADCVIFPGAVLYHDVRVGDRVRIHANAVVGSDGFGYAWDGKCHRKIPQVGTVEVGDDVEIGACTTIDRARFGRTVIGRGSKLDNQVQIAHNVKIGAHCAFAAQVGISGSTVIGDGVLMGGQSGAAGHLEIGSGAVFSAKAGITKSLEGGVHYTGHPAVPHKAKLDEWRSLKALPRLRATVRELERKLALLEEKLREKE